MDGYTPAQAAAVTGLPLAAVHKAIDSRLIRPRTARSGATVRRLLTKEQLIFLQLEAEGLRLLPVGTRREIAESIQRSPKTEKLRVANGTALLIQIGPARRRIESHLKQLARVEEMVVSDPEIMRGTPVFKGTRIPVDLVADMLAQGATAEEILEGYSTLDKEKIAIAPLYTRAFPRRGRPSRRPWQGRKARRRVASGRTSIRSLVVDAMERKFGSRRRTPVLAPPVPGTGKPGPQRPDEENPYGLLFSRLFSQGL